MECTLDQWHFNFFEILIWNPEKVMNFLINIQKIEFIWMKLIKRFRTKAIIDIAVSMYYSTWMIKSRFHKYSLVLVKYYPGKHLPSPGRPGWVIQWRPEGVGFGRPKHAIWTNIGTSAWRHYKASIRRRTDPVKKSWCGEPRFFNDQCKI